MFAVSHRSLHGNQAMPRPRYRPPASLRPSPALKWPRDYVSSEKAQSLTGRGRPFMAAGELTETIGRTLAELRQSRGWTLKTLSEATGVSVPVLSKIENNQTGISFETAMKIMDSLSLSLDELTGGK